MNINTPIVKLIMLTALLSMFAACSTSVPKDERIEAFSTGLPSGELTPITAEYPNESLLLNDEGLGDRDGDAVADFRDECDEKGLVDTSHDNKGCNKEISAIKTIDLVVQFTSNQSVVDARYYAEIERLAKLHQSKSGQKILIEGHTDSTGSRTANLALSLERARAVATLLAVKFNVGADDILISGLGPDQPIATNKTSVGRKSNRRMLAHMVYEDRMVQHDWNIWSVELGDKKSQVQQYRSFLDI